VGPLGVAARCCDARAPVRHRAASRPTGARPPMSCAA